MNFVVKCHERRLYTQSGAFPCAIGRGGCLPAAQKTEGDGATPLGLWPLRRAYFRADRLTPPDTKLPLVRLSEQDGWCDAPLDPNYNRRVHLPYPASHERLWRNDPVYDLIVELGHNDDPVIPYRGSAVFIHLARDSFTPTQGCVALRIEDLLDVLAQAEPSSCLEIRAD